MPKMHSPAITPGKLLKTLLAILLLIVTVFPVWWMINIVFSEPGVSIMVNPRLYPTSLIAGITKIIKVFNETTIARALLNSSLYALFQVTGIIILSSMAAFEFSLHNFPGKRFLFILALFSLMVPTAVTLIPTYLFVVDLGWINTLQGLVVPGLASAFGLFVMTQFMEQLPRELFDAGEIDGLSHFGLFWKIAFPLSKNAIITLAILQFVRTWGNYIWPLVISARQEAYTIGQLVGLYNSRQTYATIDVIMTVNFLSAIPTLLFYFFFQRYILQSVATTGIK